MQGFKQNLHAVFCLAENAVGPAATRPDDVHTLYSGRTVEINNTDAEGRLVLGDGVAYARKVLKADWVVDMATLTSAQVKICLFCLFACLLVVYTLVSLVAGCLLFCLFVCLFVLFFVCLLVWSFVFLFICFFACLFTFLFVYFLVCFLVCLLFVF